MLPLELHIEGSSFSSSSSIASTGVATYPGLHTDDPTASPSPSLAPKPSDPKRNKGSKPPRKCLYEQFHMYAHYLYLIPSVRPDGRVTDLQIMTQAFDALNRSEKEQRTIRKLVEKSKRNSNSDTHSDEALPA
jgi:hypothetical protein